MDRRIFLQQSSRWLAVASATAGLGAAASALGRRRALAEPIDPKTQRSVVRGLEWMANTQSRLGHWTANNGQYPTAMTALAGLAFLAEGSTATQGKYAENLRDRKSVV